MFNRPPDIRLETAQNLMMYDSVTICNQFENPVMSHASHNDKMYDKKMSIYSYSSLHSLSYSKFFLPKID